MLKIKRFAAIAVCACAALAISAASAQTWPAKQIRFISPFAPGGGADITSRVIAQKLSEALGQPVLVDNRGGAGGRTRAVNRVPACGM